MKSKKLISLLCAAAMTTSAFAGMVTTASAATEADILWSDTFNGAAAGVIADGTNSQQTVDDYVNGLTFVTTNRGSGDKASYTDSEGNYVLSGSYYSVMDDKADASDKYLRMSFPHFGDFGQNGRWAHVDLGSGYAATADKDVVMDFDLKITDGLNKGEKSEKTPTLRIGSFDPDAKTATAVEIDKAKYSIGDDWVHARIIVSNSNGAKLYIGGTEVAGAANTAVKTLNSIGLYSTDPTQCGDGAMTDLVGNSSYDDGTLNDASKPTKSAIADIDNVIIYNEAAGVATGTSDAPGAKDQEGGATPKPVATAVPIGTAPTLAISTEKFIDKASIEVYNFDDLKPVKWSLGTEEQNVEAIDGLNIHIGARSNGGSVSTFAGIAKGDSDNVLQMQAGQYAHAGRAPRLNVKTSMADAFADGKTLAMSMAVKLSVPLEYKDNPDAKPRLYFMKNENQAGEDGAGAYNTVAAVLTTVEDEEITREGSTDVISTYITPDEWHYVTFVVSPTDNGATHRLYVDGGDKPAVNCDYVGKGATASSMDDLPMITVQSKAAKIDGSDVGPDYGLANIDNLMVYSGEPSEPRRMCATPGEAPDVTTAPATPTPQPKHDVTVAWDKTAKKATVTAGDGETEAFDGVLIHASYDNKGTMTSVTTYDAKNITTDGIEIEIPVADVVHTGDKLMVWNSMKDMIPYGMAVVEDGEAPVVKYSVKVADTQNGTVTVTPSGNVVANTEVTITATPDEGYEVDTITVKDADNGDVAVANNKFTVVDKDVTVTVTFKEVSEETPAPETPKPADKYVVTVAAAENGTVTADKSEAAEGETVTLTVKPNMGYEGTVTVKDADNGDVTVTDNKFTMPAKAVNVTAAFTARTDVVLSTASTYLSRYNGLTEDIATQVAKNYSDDTKVLVGTNGNYNAIGLYKFTAPAIPADKEIASAKLTIVNKEMNNKNGDSSVDVNYPDVSTGIDFSTITWNTMFTQATVDDGTNLPFVAENMQETAPFKNITKLATVTLARAETNVTHGDIDVTSYVKAQTKKSEDIVIVLNKCTRGANLEKVAMIEYTLQDKTYTANVTAPAETDGTLSVDKTAYNKDETATITVTAKPGKKVASVTVMNGETEVTVTPGENGTYTFIMPEADVTVSATFARADIETIEVAGPKTVSSVTTNEYTATAKAADGTVLEGVTFTWSVTGGGDGTSITDGVLTVADSEADQTALTIKAEAEGKEGTLAASVTKATVYTITAATELTGGSVATDKMVGIEGAEVTVTPTASTGYQVATVTYTPAEGEAQTITPAEGVYKFNMPAANVTVSATFTKVDYAITNATAADAGGTITVAATAQIGDEVTITVAPDTGKELAALTYKAESAAEATAITAAEGVYKFTMPAEAVTVTATFQKEAIVRPVVSGVDVISTYDTTAVRVGDRNVLQAPTGNKDFNVTDVGKNVVTYDTDFLVSDGEVLYITFGRSKGDAFGGQSSTLIITGANSAITMQGQNGGSSYTGLTWTGEAPALTSGTWYRLTATTKSNGTTWDGAAIAVYAVDPTTCEIGNKLGEGTLSYRTGTSNTEWNRIQYGVTGTPSIDNTYVYTPAKYTAEVTVVDGDNTAVEGVTVKLNDLASSTATTNAEGKATFTVPAGEYTVTVEKLAYNAPADEQKITVTAEGGSKTVTMSAISQVLTSVDIKGGAANQTVLTKGTDTVVAKLTAVGYDADSAEMATQPTINWTSDSENTTVANGVVTVKSTQAAGTVTITATAADTAISDTYTFTVAATGTETVVLASEDFEDDVNNFVLANGASVGTFKDSKVLKLGGTDGATATMTLDTPVTAVTGDTVKVTWTAYNGWLTSGADTVWTLKNSADEVVLSYTYNTGSCNITAVTLAGVAQEVTAFNFQQNGSKQNGWGSFSYANQNSVELTLNADGSATVVFKKGTTTAGTYTVEAANTQLTNKDIKSAEMLNHALNDDRSGGFDNFTTTITRAE